MTEKQKKKADEIMFDLWIRFVYKEAMINESRDYRHLDELIRRGYFTKKYLQCEKRIIACWIFILCDGEFGYFDGYDFHDEIPVALAKLVGEDISLSSGEITVKNGNYVMKY